jgi:hypothetical protein
MNMTLEITTFRFVHFDRKINICCMIHSIQRQFIFTHKRSFSFFLFIYFKDSTMKYKKKLHVYGKKETNERTLKTARRTYMFISNHCLIIYKEYRPKMTQKNFIYYKEKRIVTKNRR